jgi:hypothetical protein
MVDHDQLTITCQILTSLRIILDQLPRYQKAKCTLAAAERFVFVPKCLSSCDGMHSVGGNDGVCPEFLSIPRSNNATSSIDAGDWR